MVKYYMKDYAASIVDFTKAIELDPEFALSYANRGIVKMDSGDEIGACIDWKLAEVLGNASAKELVRKYCKNE